jgi:hypothetical protein
MLLPKYFVTDVMIKKNIFAISFAQLAKWHILHKRLLKYAKNVP